MSAVSCKTLYISTDVTSVKFIGKWILAGIGGCIHVFDVESAKFVTKEEVFEGQKVHNIFDGPDKHVAITGGKLLQILHMEKDADFVITKLKTWASDDWIQNLQWLGSENLALITSHNVISLWNIRTGERLENVYCEVKCILYSALLIGSSWDDLLAFAGTVFQQILIWAPTYLDDSTGECPVLHTLTGHNGVIFSISYDPVKKLICSTSDDRSVRIWGVTMRLLEGHAHVEQWRSAQVTLLHTMYGHMARVWRNILTDTSVISVGEDSRICIWNLDGLLDKSWTSHQNGCVWSVDYNREQKLIVTGGGDGGINLWSVANEVPVAEALTFNEDVFDGYYKHIENPSENFPRRIGLTAKGNIVTVTGSGCLLYYTFQKTRHRKWCAVYHSEKLANYCLLEMSPCRQYVALGNMNGAILIFTETEAEKHLILNLEKKVVNGRIFSLHWLSSEHLLTCGLDGLLEVWSIELPDHLEKLHEFELPKSKERWISAACLNGKTLVCGDRVGSIHLFVCDKIGSTALQLPVQSFNRIHGHLGVSSLKWCGNILHSTGRDGTLRSFILLDSELRLDSLNADKLCMDWPAATTSSDYGLLILGFKSVNFIIWSHTERRTLLKLPCGGGHRSWDWILKDKTFTFIYIKEKLVFFFTCALDDLVKPVLKTGIHSKQITCMREIPSLKNCRVLLSGSEDTTIQVTVLNKSSDVQRLAVLQSHISNVRCLALCALKDSTVVFSGGGRAQLKVWKMVVMQEEDSELKVTCKELCSHMLRSPNRNKKPWLSMEPTIDPETRYMDLSAILIHPECTTEEGSIVLAAGCSDGFLRIFSFDLEEKELIIIGKYSFHNRCILKVLIEKTKDGQYIVFTMATDGKVALWNISDSVEDVKKSEARTFGCEDDVNDKIMPFHSVQIHQSGINSFEYIQQEDGDILLVTGGDDCALVLSLIHIFHDDSKRTMAEISTLWRNDLAHLSQITGLKLIDNTLITTSIDQRVSVWEVNYDIVSKTASVVLMTKYCTTIPDIQGLLSWNSRSLLTACVYGQGLEVVNIQLPEKL